MENITRKINSSRLASGETCKLAHREEIQPERERPTYRAVIKKVEQGDEESPSVLPVPTDHGVEMRAESGV